MGSVCDRLPRLAEEATAGFVALQHEIHVGIVNALGLGARADLEIDRITTAAIDQAMSDTAAGPEAGGVTGGREGSRRRFPAAPAPPRA